MRFGVTAEFRSAQAVASVGWETDIGAAQRPVFQDQSALRLLSKLIYPAKFLGFTPRDARRHPLRANMMVRNARHDRACPAITGEGPKTTGGYPCGRPRRLELRHPAMPAVRRQG